MKSLDIFEYYLKQGIVKKQSPDKLRADSLVQEAKRKLDSLNAVLKMVGLNNDNANDIIESCYDIIIGLTRAKMLSHGFNSQGLGAHEAEVAYLRELRLSEMDIQFANQLRYFRNGIMYYGKKFDREYAQKVLAFLNKVKPILKNQ